MCAAHYLFFWFIEVKRQFLHFVEFLICAHFHFAVCQQFLWGASKVYYSTNVIRILDTTEVSIIMRSDYI